MSVLKATVIKGASERKNHELFLFLYSVLLVKIIIENIGHESPLTTQLKQLLLLTAQYGGSFLTI